MQYVRPSKNFVNLGKLYHVTPLKKGPPGWAYFDDGSIFIAACGYLSHENLEARMKIAAHLVTHPVVRLHAQSTRHGDILSNRFIVVNKAGKGKPDKVMVVLARNASDGERVFTAGRPFLQFAIILDKTGTCSPLIKFDAQDEKIAYEGPLLKEAMRSFRGTLSDGMLQPNVRLSNGLILRGMQKTTHEEGSKPSTANGIKRVRDLDEITTIPKLSSTNDTKRIDHDMDEVAAMEAALQARERDLELREELLRWKERSFRLGKKLAEVTQNRVPRRHTLTPRYRKNNDGPVTVPRYRNYNEDALNPRFLPDNTLPATTTPGYKVRAREGPVSYRPRVSRTMGAPASTHPLSDAVEACGLSPTVPLDDDNPASTPSTRGEHGSKSTSDIFAASVLGTDTSAPPALDRLRTLLGELNEDGKPGVHRRRSLQH